MFDNSLAKLRRLQTSVGHRIYTSIIQPKVLSKALMRADIVIGAVRSPFGKTPCIVSEEMVSNMKTGAIIIDVSIEDRKSTRLNSSHVRISYAVFCLKKKKIKTQENTY